MACTSSLRSRVTEITKCPICMEDFTDPRSLPCVHSFCLRCLEGVCRNKSPGDNVPCPVCRKKFQIPQGGLQIFPHNFSLQNLVEAKTTTFKPGDTVCEPCCQEGRTKPATVYCVDCSQNLCDRCSTPHKNWKKRPHDVRPMGEDLNTELARLCGSYCDKHTERRLEMYCFDCKLNVCMKCFAVSHQRHQCQEIEEVAKDFVASIKSDIKPLSPRISKFREAIKQLEMENERFLQKVKRLESEVQRKGDEMKRLVDDHVTRLLKELNEVKTTSEKRAKTHVKTYELAVTALESFHIYASELTSKGSACDITRAANDLHIRADELLRTYVSFDEYRPPDVQFVPLNVERVMEGLNNIVGYLLQSQCQQVIHKFPSDDDVFGLTLLNKELYVLRKRDTDQVDVYSTTADFTLLRRLNVTGLSDDMRDITSCVQKQCIYLADCGDICIHRVGLDNSESRWPVTVNPECLSVTPACNILVTCIDEDEEIGKLVELSSEDGQLLREVTLQSDIDYAVHAVQLASNRYVVCYGDISSISGVSVVAKGGRIKRSNSRNVKLNCPYHIAVDDNEFIFVADVGNHRVVLFDPSLNYVRNVLEHMQLGPRRLCFDDTRQRLYVAQDIGLVSVVQM